MWVADQMSPKVDLALSILQDIKANLLRFQDVPQRLWLKDEKFMAVWKRVQGYTLVDYLRCHVLWQLSAGTAGIHGHVAEVGVYKGGTAFVIAQHLGPRALHLFDTFEGMPETSPSLDKHTKGNFSDTSVDLVKGLFKDRLLQVSIHKGLFPSTAKGLEKERWSLVHVDADIYQSVLDSCRFFWDRLSEGGAMVFDDYGFVSCPGAKKAVDEFFTGKASKVGLYLSTGQYLVYKAAP